MFIGKREEPLTFSLLLGAIIPSVLASITGQCKIIDFKLKMDGSNSDNLFAEALTQTVGIGLYLIIIARISVLLNGSVLKKSGGNSSDPIESKKE